MLHKMIDKLLEYETIGVYSHIRPDGDCIGAQVGLCFWLQQNGVDVYAFNDDPVPVNLTWLADYFPIQRPDEDTIRQCDAFVVLDGNTPSRFGSYEWFVEQFPRPTYMIDHHPDPDDHFDISFWIEDASSTCELIFQFYWNKDIEQITPEVAKALYTGILTDTGSLRYDSVTPDTLTVASELLRRGNFRPNEVAERLFVYQRMEELELLGLALQTIELHADNQIATMCVTSEMLEKTDTTNDDCRGFVSYPLSIAGIKAAILFKDLGEGIKMSLRSKSEVDVNQWARLLGGGGHKKAAGAWHPGPLDQAVKEVVQLGVQHMLNSVKS